MIDTKTHKLTTSNLITIKKDALLKCEKDLIPDTIKLSDLERYYYDKYEVKVYDNKTIEVRFVKTMYRGIKLISFPETTSIKRNYINIHIPSKVLKAFNNHMFWRIVYKKNLNRIFLIKSSKLDYNGGK